MVFLIQNAQNRDSAAVQIKLDELIRSSHAHNALLGLEDLDEASLERLRKHYRTLAERSSDRATASQTADDVLDDVLRVKRVLRDDRGAGD